MFKRLLKWFIGPTIVPQVPEPKSIREIMELITRPAVVRTRYVCGFAFHGRGVVLIQKVKPEWQAGKFNGVGGKIESGETPEQAMAREFKEETGVNSHPSDWEVFAQCVFRGADVIFLRAFDEAFRFARTVTPEHVVHWSVDGLPDNLIPNLRWLIPLALHNEPGREIIHINYEQN